MDVALSYGYDTQSGFNKAFVAQYGCYPTDYRKNAAAAHARYPERRSRMFMLSDRCSMLRDGAVEKKSIAKKICMQSAFYFVQGAAAADNVSPQEAFAAVYGAGENQDKLNDSYLCTDLLAAEKHASHTYDTCIFEFKDKNVRNILNLLQKQEQGHGEVIYNYMSINGMY